MRSLRGRLTAGVTVVLAVALLVTGLLAAREARQADRDALDDRLRRTAELSRATALAAVQEELPAGDRRLDAVLDATRTSLRLVLGSTPLLETGDPPPRRPALPPGLSTFEAGGARYRAYVTSLRDESLGGLARLELTTDITPLDRRQAALRRRLVLLGLLALVLSAAGVFLASGVVLRPLRRLRDMTARIAGQEDLDRRVPAEGPAELRSLAASFNAMLGRLSRSAADRPRALDATRRFAADAGHELRTPLTSIRATLSALVRHPELPAERRTRMAAETLAQQERLVALLEGLQALARGDASHERAPVDLAEVVDASLEASRERHPQLRWSATLPDDPVVLDGWAPGLRSLVDNLLENAARHGGDGGEVGVLLAADGPARLVVEDGGPGVPEAERERLFEPFARLAPDGRPGSGLGLAIVAQQARHHGATVDVDRSERLGGARFTVRFPLSGRSPRGR
jgi:two-component system, OmpR family, sensor histidine kinase PrrB